MAIKKRGPRGGLVTTRIPIYTLSSVSTQAANKRLPNEAEALDNVLITMERAFEKRPGCEILPQNTISSLTEWDYTNTNTRYDLFSLTNLNPTTSDLWAYWHTISEIAKFLIVVDFKATAHTGGSARNLFYVFRLMPDGSWKEETPASQTGSSSVLNSTVRDYITYGSATKTARESLKAVSSGASILILNTNVYAGFSSDTAETLFNLDGTSSANPDIAGRAVTYFSSSLTQEQTSTDGAAAVYNNGYKRVSVVQADHRYIPVQDFKHHIDANNYAYWGQNITDVTVMKLPPRGLEVFGNNENLTSGQTDNKARLMLKILYDPLHPFYNNGNDSNTNPRGIDGRGKIMYLNSPYLEMSEGYYRIINFAKGITYSDGATSPTTHTGTGDPYLQKIRTPYKHSYIDPRRMPMRLSLTVDSTGTSSNWKLEAIAWTPRLNGNNETNTGPTVFKKSDGTLKQVQIKAMAIFKNRLWFAAEDAVFGSAMNSFENFFLYDVTNIKDTDPIDIKASSNVYNEIVSLTPFRDFLFVNTKNNTQFQLMAASANELTPTNVMIKPVSYYATSGNIEPKLIGSQLFFFDKQRLYLFVGENSFGYATAVEVSATCSGYLPSNYLDSCSIFSKDTLAVIDADNKNTIFMYTNKFSGDKFLQSSFYKFILDLPTIASKPEILSIQAYDDYLYLFYYLPFVSRYFLGKIKFTAETLGVPRLDSMIKFKLNTIHATNWNAKFDTSTGLTTFRVPKHYYIASNSFIVLGSGWTGAASEDISYTILKPTTSTTETNYVNLNVLGNYAQNNKEVYIGRAFRMNVQLSTLFVRDENNNIVDGVLNLRTGVFRHYNTGNYDISVTHNQRTPLVSTFSSQKVDLSLNQDPLPLEPYVNQGEFVAKVFGHSDTTTISIVSDYLTPCNITNMEFKGKFKQKYNSQS